MRSAVALRKSVVVTLLSLCGSGLGFVLQLLLASEYGLGREINAYFFALSFPLFVAGLLGVMFGYLIAPQIVLRECNGRERAEYMQSSRIGAVTLSILVVAGGMLFSGNELAALPRHSEIAQVSRLSWLLAAGWLAAGGQIFLSFQAAALNGLRRHGTAAAILLGPPCGAIAATYCLANSLGVYIVPVGNFLGASIASAVAARAIGSVVEMGEVQLATLRRMLTDLAGVPLSVAAMTCFSAYAVIDAFWAPRAGGAALGALSYSHRLLIAMGSLIVVGPSALVMPGLASCVREKKGDAFRWLFIRALLSVGVTGAVVGGIFFALAPRLVQFLFVRHAFTAHDALLVVASLRRMVVGMVAMLISVMAMRALFCLPNSRGYAAALGFCWAALYFALSGLYVRHGVVGIAMAYSVTWCVVGVAMVVTVLLISDGRIAGTIDPVAPKNDETDSCINGEAQKK